MTPKEKAKELVNKMFNCDKSTPEESMAMLYPHAKQCALIAVDLRMEHPSQLMYDIVWFEHRQTDINNWYDTEPIKSVRMNALKYWNEVKNEIKLL